MGIILAKFRKEKSTQDVLEALQEKIQSLENITLNTQEQKKRVVGNFLAISIGVYVIAFVVFYFVYFPPTWQERIIYSIPLLLFPIVIILLRHLFTWYYQRKLNKNSKKLTALRAEKKKILEQVMDKETYKVAVNLLARFADKPESVSRTTYSALSSNLRTPSKHNTTLINRSASSSITKSTELALTTTITPTPRISGNTPMASNITSRFSSTTPRAAVTALASPVGSSNQLVRRRTPFPVINQLNKGVFEKIVDVLIGDGPGDRFAMICKECYAHNGMALKEDFEYASFRCAFCNAFHPARKARPAAPRLTITPAEKSPDSSSEENDDSDDERTPAAAEISQFTTPLMDSMATRIRDIDNTSTSSSDDEQQKASIAAVVPERNTNEVSKDSEGQAEKLPQAKTENIDKSDSAIDDVNTTPEEK